MPITLLSDLGINSPYVPWLESHIRQELSEHNLMTLSHEVKPFKIFDAVLRWKCTLGKFPSKTYHVSAFDTILSFPQHILVRQHDDVFYIGVDNGMISTTFDYSNHPDQKIYATKEVAANFQDFINIVIKSIKTLDTSGIEDSYFFLHPPNVIYNFPQSIIHQNRIDCQVLAIDRQDNIITDLTYETYLEHLKGKKYVIRLHRNDSINTISENPIYDNRGELMAYFNDFGFMQISMSSKSQKTASLLGFQTYQKESSINSYISIDIIEE